jgi:HD-like signal output (HDOD) protein
MELAVAANGGVSPGYGVVVAFVPATGSEPAVVVLACDPRHDPGRPILELAPAVIPWIHGQLGQDVAGAVWAVIDNYGRFVRAVPADLAEVGAPLGLPSVAGGTAIQVAFERFETGTSMDDFFQAVGVAGEASMELLSMLVDQRSEVGEEPPSAIEFIDTVEAHGKLPAPGLIFRKVSAAAEEGDARKIAMLILPDPVISSSMIGYANAARFAAGGKTASVPQAVTRLGTSFVKRVVFLAEMMVRYRKGVCPEFDYRAFWLNAVATGAAMRALLPEYEISAARADDAFTTGLVSGMGWLAIAETYPALMARYIERCKGADPVSKARAQREIFPAEVAKVTERYLQSFEFPQIVTAAAAGRKDVDRQWSDILARATRIAQAMSPFECLAIPTTVPVPDACRAEWTNWQTFVTSLK